MSSSRRDRSRSPRGSSSSRRRERHHDVDKGSSNNSELQNNILNQQMLMNNMYTQGNMLMGGGMYPNMMMPNAMMSAGLMSSTGMDMMQTGNMDLLSQTSMDITSMGGQTMPSISSTTGTMDMGMMNPQMSSMMMDHSVMGNMAMYPTSDMSGEGEKKEIVLAHCKLTPPEPGAPDPPRRAKPPGCRTIFIGGLPDNTRESIIREIFENYGRIHILRLSTKNFCHIRFDKESSVEAAMTLSGYRIKLVNKGEKEEEDTKANSGWLHVDYALSRDDQNEFEKRHRQALRAQEQQLQQMSAQQRALAESSRGVFREPSPKPAQPFSNASIAQLLESIKSEEHFSMTLPTLIAWLERGECSKRNSTQFYSMIQATNSHIRRLFNEKVQAEEELQEAKEKTKVQIQSIIDQLEQVAKVFTAATHQRVWDHFTKPQRKNIETWQKMSQEFNSLREEFYEKFNEDNEYNNGYMNKPFDMCSSGNNEETKQLKLENDSLKFQLEAYKNEIDVIKADAQKELEKFKAQFIARQALQNYEVKNPPLPSPVKKPPPPPPLPDDVEMKPLKETVECGEAKLIGIIAAFLQVHPQGASLDYVISYVRALFPQVNQASVHQVLQKHTDAFLRTTTGVGANIEHRWNFIGYRKEEN